MSRKQQEMIDKCFEKMSSVFNTYSFTTQQCAEAIKLEPELTRKICEIERLPPEELNYDRLRDYYDYHLQIWRKYKIKTNKLTDRFKMQVDLKNQNHEGES